MYSIVSAQLFKDEAYVSYPREALGIAGLQAWIFEGGTREFHIKMHKSDLICIPFVLF